MAILFPMPRGGSGYGVEGFKAIVNSWGEKDYKCIMTGVDAMIAKGIADPDRLERRVRKAGVSGWLLDSLRGKPKRDSDRPERAKWLTQEDLDLDPGQFPENPRSIVMAPSRESNGWSV